MFLFLPMVFQWLFKFFFLSCSCLTPATHITGKQHVACNKNSVFSLLIFAAGPTMVCPSYLRVSILKPYLKDLYKCSKCLQNPLDFKKIGPVLVIILPFVTTLTVCPSVVSFLNLKPEALCSAFL